MFSAGTGSIKLVLCVMILLVTIAAPAMAQENRVNDRGANVSSNQVRGLVESLRATGNFTKLLTLLDKAGLTDTLSDPAQTFTLFAADDNAFAALPQGTLEGALKDPESARKWILPYLLNGKFTSKDLIPPVPHDKLITLAGSSLQTSRRIPIRKGATTMLIVILDPTQRNKEENRWPCCGRVVSADHLASNGIYHAITFVSASGGVWR